MNKPEVITSFETPLATCWMEKDVLSVVTNNQSRTKSNTEEHYRILKSILQKKYFWLIDLRLCKSMDREVLDTIYTEIPKVCKGIAVVALSPCEKIVASYFLRIKSSHIPAKMFSNVAKARKWIEDLRS